MLKTFKFTLTLVASLCVFSNVFSQKEKDRIAAYVNKYKELAMAEMVRTGVPASITLAQGLLETGYGSSELAVNANNHFGIKCKTEWTGERVFHDDDTKGECFRKYASAEESYRDHSDFLKTRGHYSFLFTIDPTDYQAWAYGLKKAGYATSPTYAQRLIAFIEENNLQEYSLIALNKSFNKENVAKAETPISIEEAIEEDITATQEKSFETSSLAVAIKNENAVFATTAATQNQQALYPKDKHFTINTSKVVFVEAGTSLFAVASNNGIAYNKLLEFNDLGKVDIIEKDQLIFLERKQKKGDKEIRVVEANEDLYEISQKEGIQLSSLLEYNHLSKEVKPVAGQKLYLKAVAPSSKRVAASFTSVETSSTMR